MTIAINVEEETSRDGVYAALYTVGVVVNHDLCDVRGIFDFN